jgi:hypothetical protein
LPSCLELAKSKVTLLGLFKKLDSGRRPHPPYTIVKKLGG